MSKAFPLHFSIYHLSVKQDIWLEKSVVATHKVGCIFRELWVSRTDLE